MVGQGAGILPGNLLALVARFILCLLINAVACAQGYILIFVGFGFIYNKVGRRIINRSAREIVICRS